MNKDAYYFPHFSNARHDRKLKRLRKQFGIEGYGIYFMLLEVLRDQEDFSYPIEDLDLLADEFGTSTEKVQTVVNKYDLFATTEDEFFFSPNMIEYLRPYLERSRRARDAALKRWSEHKSDANAHANALPEQSAGNASKGEESIVKEKILEKSTNKLVIWIEAKTPRVQKLKQPITDEEAERIMEEYDATLTKEILESMDNHKDLLKKYVSANKTFRSWAKNRNGGATPGTVAPLTRITQ